MGELIDLQKYRDELLNMEIQELKRQLLEIHSIFDHEDELSQKCGYYKIDNSDYFMLSYPLLNLPYFY